MKIASPPPPQKKVEPIQRNAQICTVTTNATTIPVSSNQTKPRGRTARFRTERRKESKVYSYCNNKTGRRCKVADDVEESMCSFLHYRQHSSSVFLGTNFRILAIFFQEKKKPRNFCDFWWIFPPFFEIRIIKLATSSRRRHFLGHHHL